METQKQKQTYVGVDIGLDWLDVAWHQHEKLRHLKIPNTEKGFKQLVKQCGTNKHYVMECTGPYYLALALHLHRQGVKVSVMNALVIKRFIQMNLEKNKSDKKDASWICKYGISQKPGVWQAPQEHIIKAKQMQASIMQLTKQRTAITNASKSLAQMPIVSNVCKRTYERMMKLLTKEIKELEKALESLLNEHEGKKMKALQSIPSIGKRTAAMMIIATDGFKKVENYRQLASWAGLSPKEYSSGKSIRGKLHISKMGGKNLRNLLYMCSMTAMRKNKACKELYERLKAKGKNGKVALIAVCNKLIKQCVAIAKSESLYSENFLSKKVCF